jgi:hypothetical protein
MSIEQYRTKIKSGVWQAIAQSKVDLSALSAEDQNKLVESISDQVLIAVNDLIEEQAAPQLQKPQVDLSDDEQIVWEGKPFLSLVEFYVITTDRIKISKGLLGKDYENYELIRVQDIDVSQGFSERILGIGDITVTGADPSQPTVVLRNVRDPRGVYELMRKAWLAARKKYGLIFREDM